MKTIDVGEVASLLENYDSTESPLVLTRNGQPIAALFPVEGTDVETLSLSTNQQFMSVIERSRQSQQDEGRIFLEDILIPGHGQSEQR